MDEKLVVDEISKSFGQHVKFLVSRPDSSTSASGSQPSINAFTVLMKSQRALQCEECVMWHVEFSKKELTLVTVSERATLRSVFEDVSIVIHTVIKCVRRRNKPGRKGKLSRWNIHGCLKTIERLLLSS